MSLPLLLSTTRQCSGASLLLFICGRRQPRIHVLYLYYLFICTAHLITRRVIKTVCATSALLALLALFATSATSANINEAALH